MVLQVLFTASDKDLDSNLGGTEPPTKHFVSARYTLIDALLEVAAILSKRTCSHLSFPHQKKHYYHDNKRSQDAETRTNAKKGDSSKRGRESATVMTHLSGVSHTKTQTHDA